MHSIDTLYVYVGLIPSIYVEILRANFPTYFELRSFRAPAIPHAAAFWKFSSLCLWTLRHVFCEGQQNQNMAESVRCM